MDTGLTTALLLCLLLSHCFVIQGQVCRPDPGDKVVNMCENSFSNGNSLYLDTARAVNYQDSCMCWLQSQGGSVELLLSVRGNETDCDSTLLLSPHIEYSFSCVGKEPITATGKIEPGQVVFISLTKSSTDAKAALCVHIGQLSFGGSLSLNCYAGTLKPSTTTSVPVTTPTPTPPPTTRPSTQTVSRGLVPPNTANICSEDPNDKVINMCERDFGSGNSIYMDTTKAVNYQGDCVCQLRAQGGAVDLELSVKGVHADCNATLYLAPFIDYTFNCVQQESVSTTGKIEVGQTVYVTLSKASPDAVADLCVHIVQTSSGAGSLSLTCSEGTPKPTTTPQPLPSTTSQSANSSGSEVAASTANITTSAVNPRGSGEPRTNDTTVSFQKPPVKEPTCQATPGDKVVNMCEKSFGSGAAIYLDTAKAVNYQGRCVCQLSAQGGDVDLQLTVQGAHADCDATLYFPPPIDYTYNCADRTSSNSTGRIESGRMVFLTLTKGSKAVADFCVLLVQASSGAGSLSLTCSEGTPKPTTTPQPQPSTTSQSANSSGSGVTARTANITTSAVNPGGSSEPSTNDTNTTTVSVQKPQVIEPVCQSTSGDKVVNMCEGNFDSGAAIYLDTAKAVNYQGRCVCQLSAQGGDVDLQLSVQGAHADCDATLYFSPSIDHTYNCADRTSSNTTGRIESGKMVFLTLTKGSDAVADFCVLLVQTLSGGSLSLNCLEGKLKVTVVPPTTTSTLPNSTGSEVTKTGATVKTNSSSLPKSTTSPSVPTNTTDGGNGTIKDPQQAPLEQSPAHSTIVVSIIVVTAFGIVVLLTIIMVIAKRVRKKSSSNQVAAAPSSANGLINVSL
ncbi:mucin-5AC-like [Haliotis rufescens]|uniref:mucin-5AC-like n=1 Tax=Haliotis rufescens TaxID=6454 RepID=UPI00201F2511|nr:mucin-5AC-like [Haliotis rufescens]